MMTSGIWAKMSCVDVVHNLGQYCSRLCDMQCGKNVLAHSGEIQYQRDENKSLL